MSRIEWHDKELIKKIERVADEVSKKGAMAVQKDARRYVPKESGTLANQIKVYKNTYRNKDTIGYRVEAQASGDYDKYYAIFVELGHYSSVYGRYKRGKSGGSLKGVSPVHIPKQPYLRPALKRNKGKIKRMYQDAMK